jgi:hypothetical protein
MDAEQQHGSTVLLVDASGSGAGANRAPADAPFRPSQVSSGRRRRRPRPGERGPGDGGVGILGERIEKEMLAEVDAIDCEEHELRRGAAAMRCHRKSRPATATRRGRRDAKRRLGQRRPAGRRGRVRATAVVGRGVAVEDGRPVPSPLPRWRKLPIRHRLAGSGGWTRVAAARAGPRQGRARLSDSPSIDSGSRAVDGAAPRPDRRLG